MNLHEYQAKQLFARYGLPAPVGYACTTPREAEEAASKIGAGPWVVKCQVHAGGRGKAGGVKVVNSKEDIRAFAENWLGKRLVTYQTDANGQPVNQILVEAATDIGKELYLGAVVDRSFPSRGLYGIYRRRRGDRKSRGGNPAPDPQSCARSANRPDALSGA